MMHNTMPSIKNCPRSPVVDSSDTRSEKLKTRDDQAADAAADAVQRLTEDLDLPHRLRDVGVEKSDFRALAEDALQDLISRSVRGR